MACCVITLALTASWRPWPPPTWQIHLADIREGSVGAALITVSWAAWLARTNSPKSIINPPVSSRPPLSRVIRPAIVAASVGLIGFSIGALFAAVPALLGAATDPGAWLSVVSTMAGVAMMGPLGVLLGVWLPSRWSIVLAPALVVTANLALIALSTHPVGSDSTFSARSVALWWDNEFPVVGWLLTWQAQLSRTVLFLTLGITSTLAASGLLNSWSKDRRIIRLVSLRALSLPATVTVGLLASQPLLTVPEGAPPAACAGLADVTMCVHQDLEGVLPSLVAGVSAVRQVVGDLGSPRLVIGPGLPHLTPNEQAELGAGKPVFLEVALYGSEEGFTENVTSAMSRLVAGTESCTIDPQAGTEYDPASNAGRADDLALTIESRASGRPTGFPTLFDDMSDPELRQFLRTHASEVDRCALGNVAL